MLTMDVIPGKSVGAFALGMTISAAIAFIQQKSKLISRVELKYNEAVSASVFRSSCSPFCNLFRAIEQAPLSTDLILDLVEDGLMLRFEPSSQRLRIIEIYDLHKLALTYAGQVFSRYALELHVRVCACMCTHMCPVHMCPCTCTFVHVHRVHVCVLAFFPLCFLWRRVIGLFCAVALFSTYLVPFYC